jgi:hypothetical protein
MAEIALGIAPLFNNALDWFRYIRIARNTERDYATYQIRLDIAALRLSRWGESVNFPAADGQNQSFLSEKESEASSKVLNQITTLFKNARPKANEAGDAHVASTDTVVLNTTFQDLYIDRANQLFAQKLSSKVKWGIYKRDECEHVVSAIENLVGSLIDMCPVESQVMRNLQGLSIQEAQKLKKENSETMEEMRDLIEGYDRQLNEALGGDGKGATKESERGATHWNSNEINTKENKGQVIGQSYGASTFHQGGSGGS